MPSTEKQGIKTHYSGATKGNALMFLVENVIKNRVNTAVPVVVTAVNPGGSGSPAGRVTVKPLINQRDGEGNILPPSELFEVPYSRVQGGVAAVVIDPVPGDIGLAVFSQQDSSNVTAGTKAPVTSGSFRCFDMADGFYIGGFLNQAPSVYLELTQDNTAVIHAPSKIRLESPLIEITGQMVQTGEESNKGSIMVNGFTNIGGTITSNGVVLETHTHGGVEPGGGSTGQPNESYR